jgi:hypothetical protein
MSASNGPGTALVDVADPVSVPEILFSVPVVGLNNGMELAPNKLSPAVRVTAGLTVTVKFSVIMAARAVAAAIVMARMAIAHLQSVLTKPERIRLSPYLWPLFWFMGARSEPSGYPLDFPT